jgi:hypothetical protein
MHPTPSTRHNVDEILAEIRRWEIASRLVADDPGLSIRQKCRALLEMMAKARRSEDAAFLETAVWKGAKHLVRGGRPRPHQHDRRHPPAAACWPFQLSFVQTTPP